MPVRSREVMRATRPVARSAQVLAVLLLLLVPAALLFYSLRHRVWWWATDGLCIQADSGQVEVLVLRSLSCDICLRLLIY